MFIHYRTEGLFLKKTDRGEAAQLFTVYTKDFGKLEILGKAIRKIKSKLKSGVDLFYLSDIEFIQGTTNKTLTDAILINKFKNLRGDLRKLKIAYQVSYIFDDLVRGQEKDENIWNLLIDGLGELDNLEPSSISQQLFYYYLFWKLLFFLGYQPQIYNCINCQDKLTPDKLYFDSREGGILCHGCFKKTKKGREISSEIVKILRFILENNFSRVKKLKIGLKHLRDIGIISNHYLSFIPKLATPKV
jgi:DNA repair protein RecO (recombination protein O)